MSNIILRSDSRIGYPDADDDDEFLFEGFVELEQFKELTSKEKPKSIIVGRTGSGKTAFIRNIERSFDQVIRIDPKQVAMDHVANSTIISFLEELDVDLHLFYELLWKHIVCVALIKKVHGVTNQDEENQFFVWLRQTFNPGKYECLEYLRTWGRSFWIETDIQLREITNKFEDDLKAGLGVSAGFKMDASTASKLEEGERVQIIQRAKRIVNEIQIGKLNQVLDFLSDELGQNKQRQFFVCIDNLDERWVDTRIQFKLIRALVDTLKAFRRVEQLKIIVSIRADFYERALLETRELGFQKEKYDTYIVKLKWSKKDLQELLDKRINILFRQKYTKAEVKFDDIFPADVRKQSSIDYLIERTLFRPRDAIAFVNQCFENSAGQTQVTVKSMQAAEHNYSRDRRGALEEEWQSVHPELPILINFVGKPRTEVLHFKKIVTTDLVDDVVTAILGEEKTYKFSSDLVEHCRNYYAGKISDHLAIAREVFSILYKVGAIGLKSAPQQPYQYCYANDPVIAPQQISDDASFRVHPMLWRALGITPNI